VYRVAVLLALLPVVALADEKKADSFVADGAKLEKLWDKGEFTEGPAYGPDGCVYFSDIGKPIDTSPKTARH
jgi:hypothetical protein